MRLAQQLSLAPQRVQIVHLLLNQMIQFKITFGMGEVAIFRSEQNVCFCPSRVPIGVPLPLHAQLGFVCCCSDWLAANDAGSSITSVGPLQGLGKGLTHGLGFHLRGSRSSPTGRNKGDGRSFPFYRLQSSPW
eukprot:GHVT01010618.1.p1 GENE.GHVT01010618.1~~GHVT01010618.1.p1  ORF type:complete len:133 (+),score=3.23 GHVT01010618.1:980-1378(+)